jgi:MFS family permease
MTHTTALRPVAPSARPDRLRVGHGGGFWVVAAAFGISLAFSTMPTPLYGLYQQRDGFPTPVITVVFAAYAVGVVASLYLVGHVSDWFGRRPVILLALLAEALAAVGFLTWPDLPGLLLARLISGIGIGAVTATATAHLSELRLVSRPGEDVAHSGLIATVVNLGGLSLGPLVSGLLTAYVGRPLTTPFVVFLVLQLVSAIAITLVPETVVRLEERPAYRPQRVSLPAAARPAFVGAALGAFAAMALSGLYMALAPTLLGQLLHESSRLVGGLTTFSLLAAGALAQLVFASKSTRSQLRIGLTLISVGLVAIPAAALAGSLWFFLVGGILAGAGLGLNFRASVATAASLAEAPQRGEVLAALFLAAYVGLAIPAVLIGLALIWEPSWAVLVAFAAIELVLVLWAGRRTLAATVPA